MCQYNVHFVVSSVEDMDREDRKRFHLSPEPSWDGGPERMSVVLSDRCPWGVGERVSMLVDRDDFVRHGHVPPPEWVRLQYDLDAAVAAEEYEFAAVLRDEIARQRA